jgi:negative regulator of flagellin synthesis FlgM
MTNPISQFGRKAQIDTAPRTTVAKGDLRSLAASTEAAAKPAVPQSDELKLSQVARQAMQEPEFDRAKVDAIKLAIQQGQYPLDSRRIAENFVAIEKMIKG